LDGSLDNLAAVASAAIEVRDLRKAYGPVEAVRGVSFDVDRGEVFGLLGPNGAGKTTTVEILEGYRQRSAGDVRVLGHDPAERERELQQRVGIVLQSCGFYPRVTVREAVAHFAKAYERPRDPDETIELVGLNEKADARAKELSGGQRRRLDLALALVGDPELVFLDEPTTGFDPAARRTAWGVVRTLKELGKTVLLTTHYLDEAQALSDRVAIVKEGRIVAEGPPDQLGPGASRYRVSYLSDGRRVEHQTDDPTELLHRLTRDALARGERLEGLDVSRPTLEEIYLELTAEADSA
jgi:ABC-2 type transport system ATP-binding protein